jgi:excisionase family DNA binding protein
MHECPQLLLLEEVAREARVSVSTVRFWIAAKKLPSVRPGRRRLVKRADLNVFLAPATADAKAHTITEEFERSLSAAPRNDGDKR